MYSIVYALQTVGYEMGEKNGKKQLRYKVAGEHCCGRRNAAGGMLARTTVQHVRFENRITRGSP